MKEAMGYGEREGDGSSESGTDSTSLLRFITLINIHKISHMGQALFQELGTEQWMKPTKSFFSFHLALPNLEGMRRVNPYNVSSDRQYEGKMGSQRVSECYFRQDQERTLWKGHLNSGQMEW